MGIKAAIVGTFCSGKTTLLANLQGHDCLRHFCVEICAERKVRQRMGKGDVFRYQTALLAYETYRMLTNPYFITETPCLLADIYAREAHVITPRYTALMGLVNETMGEYDIWFRCTPQEVPFKMDGVRGENHAYNHAARLRIDNMICEELTKRGIKWVDVSGTVEERMQIVAKHIYKLL